MTEEPIENNNDSIEMVYPVVVTLFCTSREEHDKVSKAAEALMEYGNGNPDIIYASLRSFGVPAMFALTPNRVLAAAFDNEAKKDIKRLLDGLVSRSKSEDERK